jgi:hypothetical protein
METFSLQTTLPGRLMDQVDWYYKENGIRDPEEAIARLHNDDCKGDLGYDGFLADFFAYASTWAYADPATFALMMAHRGTRRWRYYYMRLGNDPLFVVSSAYLMQSYTGDVGVLVFRGTMPTNVINWLTDLTVKPERFLEGHVHGGILRNLKAIWPLVSMGLYLMDERRSLMVMPTPKLAERDMLPLAKEIEEDNSNGFHDRACGVKTPDGKDWKIKPMFEEPRQQLRPLKALYITGHSLGGAMAALAMAKITKSPKWRDVRCKLRGCYTYGAPMVASPILARVLEESIGKNVYRHVYAKDVVPQLPPHSTGEFTHFGQEYRCPIDGKGWSLATPATLQTGYALGLPIAALGIVLDQFPRLRRYVRMLPRSIDDHSPRYYMQVSSESLTAMF